MVIGFAICSIVAAIFLLIGISTWKSKEPVGFFTFVKRPDVSDTRRYNHAVSVLWIAAAVILELACVPFLFLEQNSPLSIVILTTDEICREYRANRSREAAYFLMRLCA